MVVPPLAGWRWFTVCIANGNTLCYRVITLGLDRWGSVVDEHAKRCRGVGQTLELGVTVRLCAASLDDAGVASQSQS